MVTEFSPEVRQFILDHENDDERSLVLRHGTIFGIPASAVAAQIAGRRKARNKLPAWYNEPAIIYPPSLSLEQCSSEKTAGFKKSVVENLNTGPDGRSKLLSGQGADLTGGFGVDSFFLSPLFGSFHYVEPDTSLLETARHNHRLLGARRITYHPGTAEEFLRSTNVNFELMFADPSRRSRDRKVITLSGSAPDIISLQSIIFQKSRLLLVKSSPLLDIALAIRELNFVRDVFVIASDNEVKELLLLSENGFGGEINIHAVNLTDGGSDVSFDFTLSEEKNTPVSFSDPRAWLYEPQAAILKAGAFKSIAKRYQVEKLGASTHLYTSDELRDDFPGRIFRLEAPVKPDPKSLAGVFPDGRANIIARNYPLSADDLRKRTKLADGGEKYLLGFSGRTRKFLFAASRIR